MNEQKYTWIKLYTETLDDPKMARLPDGLWRLAIELMMMAGREGQEGVLPPLADMAWSLRRREEDLEEDLSKLSQAIGLAYNLKLGRWMLTHFSERQAALTSTERMRKMRGSNPATVGNVSKPCDANVTKDVTKTSQKRNNVCDEIVTEEEKNREEEEKNRKDKSRTAKSKAARRSRAALAPKGAGGAGGDPGLDPLADETEGLFKVYAENIAELTPPREHWVRSRAEEYGVGEVLVAIREAAVSNVLNHRYMDAILIRRQNDRDKPPEPAEATSGGAEDVRERAERIIPPDPWAHLKDGVKTPLPGRSNLEPRYAGIRRR